MMTIAGRDGRNASCFLLLLTFVLFALISIFEEKNQSDTVVRPNSNNTFN